MHTMWRVYAERGDKRSLDSASLPKRAEKTIVDERWPSSDLINKDLSTLRRATLREESQSPVVNVYLE